MIFQHRPLQLFQLCLFVFLGCRGVYVPRKQPDDHQIVAHLQEVGNHTLPYRQNLIWCVKSLEAPFYVLDDIFRSYRVLKASDQQPVTFIVL